MRRLKGLCAFATVRTLTPESYRFRVVDEHAQDIRNRSEAGARDGASWPTFNAGDYTRVFGGEPVQEYCYGGTGDKPVLFIDAPAAKTRMGSSGESRQA